jgi:hypothetical protein
MNHKIITGLKEPDRLVFAREADRCKKYLEYGSGTTTLYIDKHTSCKAFVVENDPNWISRVHSQLTRKNDITFVFVDLGPVGGWGYPREVDKYRHGFPQYPKAVWELENDFDLILVDGRFRVATFLHCVLHAKEGTIIMFDDYKEREYYHVVEEIIKPEQVHFSIAKFVKPAQVGEEACRRLIDLHTEDLR